MFNYFHKNVYIYIFFLGIYLFMYIEKDQKWTWASVIGAFFAFGVIVSIDISFSILFNDIKTYFDINNTIAASISGSVLGCRFLLSNIFV